MSDWRGPISCPRLVPAFTITVTPQSASLDLLPSEVEINLRIKPILSKIFSKTIISWIGTYEDPDSVQDTGRDGGWKERANQTRNA